MQNAADNGTRMCLPQLRSAVLEKETNVKAGKKKCTQFGLACNSNIHFSLLRVQSVNASRVTPIRMALKICSLIAVHTYKAIYYSAL
jgi:hypothetical protein